MKSEEEYLSNLKRHLNNDTLEVKINEIEAHLLKHAKRQSYSSRNKIIALSMVLLFGGGGLLFQIMNNQKPKAKSQNTIAIAPNEMNQQTLVVNGNTSPTIKSKESKQLQRKVKVVALDNSLIRETSNLTVDVADYNNIASPLIDISDYENIITY